MLKNRLLIAWTAPLALLAMLLMPVAGAAIQVSFQGGGDLDELVLSFESGPGVEYAVHRVGTHEVAVVVQGESLAPVSSLDGAGMIQSVEGLEDGLLITLNTAGFGYISSPVPGSSSLKLQIFRDPIGTRWKPRQGQAQPQLKRVEPVAQPSDTAQALGEPAAQEPSLFAVPYSVRVNVNGGMDREILVETGEVVEYDQSMGMVRIKAVAGGPREVSLAPPADLERERERKMSAMGLEPAPEVPEVAPGKTPEQPIVPQDNTTADVVADELGMGGEAENEAETVPADEQRFFARVMRSVVGGFEPLPEANGAQPDEINAEAKARIAEDLAALPPTEDVAMQNVLADIADGDTQPEDKKESALDDMEQADAEIDRYAGLSEEEAKQLESLELRLLKAQSQVASGMLDGAKDDFESIIADPFLPQDLRLEAQYSLGGVLMTLYKDSPEEHFNELTTIFNEAMNADLKSPNVPTALMNLGLVNLWVGNYPEAKAYFDILSSEHPYDENIPAIGFYYGEHYHALGDFEEAADRFQRFIETYPEQEALARQAALLLADSLQNLGLYEQAFQIVDYIDKRWPLAFEENPGFLKLAGDIEHRIGLIDLAKDHYWTYYNMNPKAESSDIVLARLGDIYLEQGEQGAARELYNRTIRDYPDMDGGLISKMRLAEEGIYDSPTFMEMVTVFDRPYSLKPKQVYTEIVEQYPDSLLAPLALLKLGMWHFFQNEYAEALTVAQRMFTDYPRSPLAERAKELGDRSFALAVPQLIEQGNHQLVVDYWERYNFADMSEGDDANATRIGVARSYAELDEFETALDLLKPFMGKEQVDRYSEMALAVEADIYVGQHAWSRIQELSAMVKENWDISERARRLMLHAEAVAMENLGQTDRAMRLWAQLGADENVEPFIRADAMYHLAKEAMNHQDLRRVYVYAQEALSQLLAMRGDQAKIKDCLLMSIYATERSGRYQQALEWALEYDKYLPRDDPEWAAARYRLARIYRKAGAENEWRNILEGIQESEPDSLYGRLAATAIETNILEERAQEYAPIPN